nr:Hsp70 family protein [uncultured Bacteroides sp.]
MDEWVCIDFGTTNSAAAIMFEGKPKLVSSGYNEYTFPTIACVIENSLQVCRAAIDGCLNCPDSYVKEFKLDIADPRFELNGYTYHDILTKLFSLIRNAAIAENNRKDITKVVFTIPALYTVNDTRKYVMSKAAKEAGFNTCEFIDEPQAAASHYSFIKNRKQKSLTLVYDLGGGTFDTALIQVSDNGEYTLLGHSGISCGGRDFDTSIYKKAKSLFELDPQISSKYIDYSKCQQIKEHLSFSNGEEHIFLSNNSYFSLSSTDFNQLIRDRVSGTLSSCEYVLNSSGKLWNNLNEILLVGGSTRLPLVYDLLMQRLVANNATNVSIIRNATGPCGDFDQLFAVCKGGITYMANKLAKKVPLYTERAYLLTEDGIRFDVNEGTFSFGRKEDCTNYSFPNDMKMSRIHFEIMVTKHNKENKYDYLLTDINSTHGTLVNSLYLNCRFSYSPKSKFLTNGDTIVAGSTKFSFIVEQQRIN